MRRFSMGMFLAVLLVATGCANAFAVKAAEEVAPGAYSEAAVVITDARAVPATVHVTSGKIARIWIVVAGKNPGEAVLDASEPKHIKPEQPDYFDVPDLADGTYALTVTVDGQKVAAEVVVGPRPDEETAEVAVLMAKKLFAPMVTRIPADKPVTLQLYSTVGMPHGDFGLFGTDIALKFNRRQLTPLKLEKGLKKGEYLISRPGFPKQKHGISAKIIAE